ncbi:4-hydroxybenzoate polyprenyltransferase-like prenyltransferase [Brachybacterium faecium DSM 4810]|uniref:4-hydroxybenzoate polyprenyltransferase-like prenyltransferase n=1 Tax=Brachybacterium faecium (strain ATCC 43885 / DSM 4810 / JCM 11609 / LMG 19847 / NBRC 14762 / NCIMB 9860 / 6-10) TaxID=446465 RepID=C7MHA4_BRAFD|nr:prenyltransferase [Brachybacterium faecium]ACU84313.1 4-hydroxybenzoate polyprenyltransferase-like prenyltransferase [Brachybacterium faecium DSM 4810]
MTAATTAPAAVRQLLGTSRPLSWINTAYPFAAAYLLAGGGVDVTLVVGTVFFLIPYNLLMYGVNDVFDHESDLRNPRKGGVEGIVLDHRLHRLTLWSAGLSTLPFALALLVIGDAVSGIVLLVVLAAVVGYSAPGLRLKERPVLDSLTSSTHFVGPAVFGLALSGAPVGLTAVASLVAFFLWGMASHAFGAVQDVQPDRAAGIGSIATVIGAARTVRLSMALYAAAGLVMLLAGWPAALAGLLALPYLVSIWPFRAVCDDRAEQAHRGWRRFLWLNLVTGFLLTQLLIWLTLRS